MSVTVALHWGPRKADLDQLEVKLKEHFEILAQAANAFSGWAARGRSFRAAMLSSPIDVQSVEALRGLLVKGQSRTDIPPRTVIPELGYSVGLWNRQRDGIEASVSVRCGGHSSYLSQDSQNTVLLKWETVGESPKVDLLILFEQLINVWTPLWGHVSSKGLPAPLSDAREIQHLFYSADIGYEVARQIGAMRHVPIGGCIWTNHALAGKLDA